MKVTLRSFVFVVVFFFCFLVSVGGLRGQSYTYTFEQFAPGTSTPILNAAPDVGSASLRASFTSAPNTTAFQVTAFQANGLFSGNALFHPVGTTGNVLTVTLNTAVNAVTLVFGSNGASSLTFACSSGSTVVASTAQSGGANFPGGSLTFSSATPFSSFTLSDGAGPEFAIDNLTMQVSSPAAAPDGGSTLLMLGIAGLVLLWGQRLQSVLARDL